MDEQAPAMVAVLERPFLKFQEREADGRLTAPRLPGLNAPVNCRVRFRARRDKTGRGARDDFLGRVLPMAYRRLSRRRREVRGRPPRLRGGLAHAVKHPPPHRRSLIGLTPGLTPGLKSTLEAIGLRTVASCASPALPSPTHQCCAGRTLRLDEQVVTNRPHDAVACIHYVSIACSILGHTSL